jgi:hypothetical protein
VIFGLATLLAVVTAALTRRPLPALLDREFRYLPVLWIGIALHILLALPLMAPLLLLTPWPGLVPAGGLLYVTSLSLLVAFSLLNLQVLGVRVIGIGLLLNVAVIAANGGQMPVQAAQLGVDTVAEELQAFSTRGVWSSHTLMDDGTLLGLLGDWIHMSTPFGHQLLLSPGDVVIVAGILLFFMVIPEARYSEASSRVRERITAITTRTRQDLRFHQ